MPYFVCGKPHDKRALAHNPLHDITAKGLWMQQMTEGLIGFGSGFGISKLPIDISFTRLSMIGSPAQIGFGNIVHVGKAHSAAFF